MHKLKMEFLEPAQVIYYFILFFHAHHFYDPNVNHWKLSEDYVEVGELTYWRQFVNQPASGQNISIKYTYYSLRYGT